MLQKLDSLEEKYNEITELMSKPEIIGDPSQFQKYARAHSELDEIVLQYREYKSVLEQIKDTREMMAEEQEDEFRLMLEEEMDSLRDRKKQLEEKLRIMLLPKDPDDDKSVIMEIRAGTEGKKQPSLLTICFACIHAMLNPRVGKLI